MVISLGVFALIALAGFALLSSVLGVQVRTNQRLERLGDMQRAMFVLSADFDQMADGPLQTVGDEIAFRRRTADRRITSLRYSLSDNVLRRTVGDRTQDLIAGVANVRWSFYVDDGGWRTTWPPAADPEVWPKAVAVEIVLNDPVLGPTGELRRVMSLPARP